ncbi:DDE-type integrase/transposase/recombinase [Streptomyces sp. M2CJ-2]|uniref:DDE-type integrase/transposase/recombinase n=1 Tax=Streptomyces sp. M2CJ-2 TaxID=2803948 RepID=UPI0027DBB764|nr:DDE-type integrase/transposase/recombinase [Streptomyces sp. M2CJ-2]
MVPAAGHEDLPPGRGVVVSCETVRRRCTGARQACADALRRRRPRPAASPPGDTWHLDEVFITVNGERQYLWRAVDRHGNVRDVLVRPKRDTRAACGGHRQAPLPRSGPPPGRVGGRAVRSVGPGPTVRPALDGPNGGCGVCGGTAQQPPQL